MRLTVVVARRVVPSAFRLSIGGTIGFEQSVDDPVELRLEGHVVARGEVGVREGRYGVRITERVEGHHPAPASPGTLEVVLAERDDGERLVGELAPDRIVALDKSQHDTVDLFRDGRLAARGYITPLGGRIGIKIVELVVC